MKPKIIVVMPALNGVEALRKTHREIPRHAYDEILVVDDARGGGIAELARELNVTSMTHYRPMGYGASQKTCFHAALARGADIVVVLHPDGRFNPGLIPQLTLPILDGEADVVLASRFLRDPLRGGPLKNGMAWYRYAANRLLTGLQNLVMGTFFSEWHTGYRAYARKALERVAYERHADGYVFENELLLDMVRRQYRFKEIGVGPEGVAVQSSATLWHSVRYALGVVRATLEFGLHRLGIRRSPKFSERDTVEHGGRPCPLCGSQDYGDYFRAAPHELKRCVLCGHVYLGNPPSMESVTRLYQDYYQEGSSARFWNGMEKAVNGFRWKRAQDIRAMMTDVAQPAILDIGCGRGWTLYFLKQQGWRCAGTQISHHAAEFARTSLGLEIFEDDLLKLKLPEQSYDVVTAFHVMEHLTDPAGYVKEVHRLLKPGGRLVVEVPNINSWSAKYFGPAWFAFDLNHHLSHFDAVGFSHYLDVHGFHVTGQSFFSLEYSIYTWFQSFLNWIWGDRDRFFHVLQTKHRPSLVEWVKYGCSGVVLLPVSFLCAVISAVFHQGDIVRIECVKKEASTASKASTARTVKG